jgi:hypothetical protein
MKNIKLFVLVVLVVTLSNSAVAQSALKLGNNSTVLNSSAVLELESTTKGFLLPRLTTAQRNTIVSPAVGLTIFNTTLNCNEWYNGNDWFCPCTQSNLLTSNGSGVVAAYACATASAGTLTAGTPVSGVTQTITATVTAVGTYSISATANGVTFSGMGTFSGTGNQNIVLTASGTPTATGSNSFTLNTTPSCSFSRTTN